MEVQFQHHHVLTFCDQNKENFSQILFKFFKRDERNRTKVDGDLEVAELDDEECAELDDEEECAELDDEECAELNDEEECAELDDEEEHAELDDEEERAELDDEEDYAEFVDEEDYPECCVCFEIVDNGPIYFCEICDGIWVHKYCASLPREIRAHPLHLQHHHSLTLQTRKDFRFYLGGHKYCDCCGDIIRIPNYYKCSECGLKLDCKCALSPDNDDLQQITTLLSPDTKTQISHDTHPHTLFLFNSRSRKQLLFSSNSCQLCDRELLDLTYGCFRCEFYLHKKCVEISQQECEVQHPCHSHHPVSIQYRIQYHREKFICDQCRDLCSGIFMAICKKCDFKIDFKCAFLRDITIRRSIGDEVKTQIRYFNHYPHLLSLFNCTNNFNLECEGCRLRLSGSCYGCLECSVYLHKSCAELPQILQHPYHSYHYLFLENSEEYCSACCNNEESPRYRCLWCPFFCLDTQCAVNNLGVISALKNKEYHQHDLYYFVHPDWTKFQCNICSKKSGGSFYICMECDSYFHVECIGIPKEVKPDYHIHSLTLMDPLIEDDIDESKDQYYCYSCENKRNPRYHAYSCQQCANTGHIFTAHIECLLSTELNENEDNQEKFPDLDKLSISSRCIKQLQISHDSHRHTLFLVNSRSRKKWTTWTCSLCQREIVDLAYYCIHCDFYLHKGCVEITQQQCEVQHPCHSHHPVSIQYHCEKFICDQCKDLCSGIFMVICQKCDFKIDFKCAFLRDTTIQRSIGDEVKNQIRYFKHDLHVPSFFNCTNDFNLECEGCRLRLSGPCYGCLECSVYFHKYCAELPQIIQHPYHPYHYLFLENSKERCGACCNNEKSPSYRCHWCPSFCLDTKCAINNLGVISALKNKEYHQHDLYYFVPPEWTELECNICSKNREGPLYICMECHSYFHVECIGLPKEVKHDSHSHPLTLMDPLTEDDIDESKDQYYCDTCEKKRNPIYHAYSCQQCVFTAHIECVLSSELNEIEHNHMTKEDDEEDKNLEKLPDLCNRSISPRCMRQLLIKDKFNDHILNYFEDITSFSCYLCDELVKSPHYECSFCEIHLHKECAKLPFKIKHNLHEHPLSIQGREFLKRFICDECQVYHVRDMCYRCEECSFSLDRMCAQGIPSTGNHYQKLNDNGSKVGFSHFSHNHKLRFAFIPEKLKVACFACRLLISGPTYCCYSCDFFLHKSCFDELKPQYIQHPFHIQHSLHFKVGEVICKACTNYSDIGYECAEGDFELDIKCVKYLTSGLQHKFHDHKLFCFVAEDVNDKMLAYWCKRCDQMCNASFYRCLDCDVNLHIECMPIPKNVKGVYHAHRLTLMDSINEEGHDEYYCYICENLRNPKHAAYYCKKCHYTAHIGCVLDEEDGETEIL